MPKSQEGNLPLPERIEFEPEGMRVQTLHSAACALFAAISYIFQTEDDVVTAEQVSHVVGFSRYHLSRMFQTFFQEAPRDLIVRTRQERAAIKLRLTTKSVGSIAQEEGYSNAESFTRAFRTEYSMTPRDFRKSTTDWRLPCPSDLHWHESLEKLPLLDGGLVEVEVVLLPAVRLATYRNTGSYAETSNGWAQLEERLPSRPWERAGTRIMTVYHDDWLRRTDERQRADLGFSIPPGVRIPAGLHELVLPRGLYIATRKPLSRAENPEVWAQMTGRWLPRRGTRPLNVPAISEHESWPLSGNDVARKIYLGMDVQLAPPWEILD
jgi:AraC family transcriptional regulator